MYTRAEFTRYLQSLYGIGCRQAAEYMGDRTEFDDQDFIDCYNKFRSPPEYRHRQHYAKWRAIGNQAYTTKRFTVYNSHKG